MNSQGPTNTAPDPDVNDPAQAAIVSRIRRISIVSSLIMIAGVGTVLAVIAFRLFANQPPAGAPRLGAVEAEGRVISAVAADGRLTVTFERNGAATIVVYDLNSLKETHRVSIGGPQPPRPQ